MLGETVTLQGRKWILHCIYNTGKQIIFSTLKSLALTYSLVRLWSLGFFHCELYLFQPESVNSHFPCVYFSWNLLIHVFPCISSPQGFAQSFLRRMSPRSSIPGCGVTFEIVSNIPEVNKESRVSQIGQEPLILCFLPSFWACWLLLLPA